MDGVVGGGWGYVWASYIIVWGTLIGYSVSLLRGRNVVRVRQRLDDDEVLELVVGRAVSADRMQVALRS